MTVSNLNSLDQALIKAAIVVLYKWEKTYNFKVIDLFEVIIMVTTKYMAS